MGLVKKAEAKRTEKWIMRRLERLARDYIKERFPEGYEGQHVYLSLTVISDGEGGVSISCNNEYRGVGQGRDSEYPIDAWKRIIKSKDGDE